MKEQSIIEREKYSRIITCTETHIEWENPHGFNVNVDLNEVVVIGEYTTDAGPFFDDWFITFVYKNGEWKSIPVYADGIDALGEHLSGIFKIDFNKFFLANSTEWHSFVRYPEELEGKALFVIHPPEGYKSPKTPLQTMKSALGLGVYGKDWDFDLTDEVRFKIGNIDS